MKNNKQKSMDTSDLIDWLRDIENRLGIIEGKKEKEKSKKEEERFEREYNLNKKRNKIDSISIRVMIITFGLDYLVLPLLFNSNIQDILSQISSWF